MSLTFPIWKPEHFCFVRLPQTNRRRADEQHESSRCSTEGARSDAPGLPRQNKVCLCSHHSLPFSLSPCPSRFLVSEFSLFFCLIMALSIFRSFVLLLCPFFSSIFLHLPPCPPVSLSLSLSSSSSNLLNLSPPSCTFLHLSRSSCIQGSVAAV